MVIEMVELVDSVEVGSRRSHLARLVGQCYHVAALCVDALAEPLLQASVVREVCHEARRIVQLYRYVVRRERNVVVALLVNPSVLFSQRLRQLSYLLTRRVHPHIHIARCARRRVCVHSRVRLTLQNAAVVARRLHLIIYRHRVAVAIEVAVGRTETDERILSANLYERVVAQIELNDLRCGVNSGVVFAALAVLDVAPSVENWILLVTYVVVYSRGMRTS